MKIKRNLAILIGSFILAFLFILIRCWFLTPLIIVADVLLFKFKFKLKRKKNGKFYISKTKIQTNKKEKRKTFKIFLIFVLGFAIFLLVTFISFILYIIITTPSFDPNKLYKNNATVIYDKDGAEISKIGAQNREKVTYEDLSEVFVNALIATEDSRFFQHNGFDLPRFLKASVGQLLGSGAGGASTLTMQVSKNNYTSTEASGIEGIVRKFRDIYISIFQIEKKYTKKEILEFYVNDPWLGSSAYGVEQAAQIYFGKSIKDVNLSEAATIAGLFNAPSSLDPFVHPESCEGRRKIVLRLMERHGYITSEEREIAEKMTIDKILVKKTDDNQGYRSFINTLVEDVIAKTGKDPYIVPMEIYTTMDSQLQSGVEEILKGTTYTWRNDDVQTGISVIDVDTGAIAAVGAGRNRGERDMNFATMIKRQIGSTAKPLYDYGPAIEYNNWSTYHPIVDEKTTYSGGGNLSNYDNKYKGLISLRYSLADSRNVPALKTFKSVDNSKIETFVTSLGLSPESSPIHEAHSIGGYNGESPLTMSAAYAAFSNGGYYTEPYTFTKIVYTETKETYNYKPKKTSVMSKETAYMITSLMQSQADMKLKAYFSGALYGSKTGTTDLSNATKKEFKLSSSAISDLWVCAINTKYSISVWYGYESLPAVDAETRNYLTISDKGHAQIFAKVAKVVFKGYDEWEKPSGVVELAIEKESYPEALASAYTPDDMITYELYKEGTEPTEVSKRYDLLDNVTNLKTDINTNTYNLKLSWDSIETPNAINTSYLTDYFKGIYSYEDDQQKYLQTRLDYNAANIGTLGYNVYIKNADGSLTLLGHTDSNSYDYKLSNFNSSITFVVKSVYSIFKANESTGSEFTESFDSISLPINASLNGKNLIEVKINGTFTDNSQPVIVLENLIDVTSLATITTTITNKTTNSVVDSILTNQLGEYDIKYTVTYKGQTYDLHKTIKIVE